MYFSKNHYLCVRHSAGLWEYVIKNKMLPESTELTDRLFACRAAHKVPKWLLETEFWT